MAWHGSRGGHILGRRRRRSAQGHEDRLQNGLWRTHQREPHTPPDEEDDGRETCGEQRSYVGGHRHRGWMEGQGGGAELYSWRARTAADITRLERWLESSRDRNQGPHLGTKEGRGGSRCASASTELPKMDRTSGVAAGCPGWQGRRTASGRAIREERGRPWADELIHRSEQGVYMV